MSIKNQLYVLVVGTPLLLLLQGLSVWLVSYLLAHQFFKSSARGILTISMLGNIVVSLAWFGPQLNGLQQYGTFSQSMLLMAVVASFVFFAIGYCPAGWLRSKRA